MESKKKWGIITYDIPHLKTSEILERCHNAITKIYLIPFKERKKRDVLFEHRPNQFIGPKPQELGDYYGIQSYPFDSLLSDKLVNHPMNIAISGAGILEEDVVSRFNIINCHPGLIPASRGLDSFKWSILNGLKLGVTMHKIDSNIDLGSIISQRITPVFSNDDINTLAIRHYRNEINFLCDQINNCLDINLEKNLKVRESNMRMPYKVEQEMLDNFNLFKEKYKLHYLD